MDRNVKDLAWKAFEKSGNAGLFVFYSALKNKNNEENG